MMEELPNEKFTKTYDDFLMICLVMTMLISPASNVQAAKKKIKISKKSVTLVVGKKVTIKVKNAPKGKKVTWSSNKKKVATVNKKGVVTAKKQEKQISQRK